MTMRFLKRITILASLCAVSPAVVGVGNRVIAAQPEMSDQAITDEVDDELLMDPGVLSQMIDTATRNGVVTLTGEVNNLLAKQRAAKIAEAVKGVRAVVNQIQVQPSDFRSDASIRRDVNEALINDPATESYELTVSVEDGEVTLDGTVDSYQERELARKVAKGVRGVTEIKDDIEIQYDADRNDHEIEQDVSQALHWNTLVNGNLIEVEVDDRVVKLNGTVGSAAEKRVARRCAWVAGVQSIETKNLDVAKWMEDDLRGDKYVKKSDQELENAVKDALLQDPRVMSFNVGVQAAAGTVTLRGEVDNLKAKRAAEQDAKNTVGVTYVNNRIKVRLNPAIENEQIEEDIAAAFLRDPYLERFETTISVINGTAHLYGSVDSTFEKSRADDIASKTLGVLDVENHLTVTDSADTYLFDPYIDDSYIGEDELADYERRAPLRSDGDIKTEIQSELWWSPFVDYDDVEVTVDNGVAKLDGTVDDWSERRAATDNAYEGGATLVDNNLLIR